MRVNLGGNPPAAATAIAVLDEDNIILDLVVVEVDEDGSYLNLSCDHTKAKTFREVRKTDEGKWVPV